MKKLSAILLTMLMMMSTVVGPSTMAWGAQTKRDSGKMRARSVESEVGTVVYGPRSGSIDGEVFLGGKYIEVGIASIGSFGTFNAPPDGFHPSMSEEFEGIGFRADDDGFDQGNPPVTGDYFLPGDPEESFTVGYREGASDGEVQTFTNAAQEGEADIPAETVALSNDDELVAKTEGITEGGKIKLQQVVSFGENDKFFKNTITLTNTTTEETVYDVRYMRSFDPDQDADLNDVYETDNQVSANPPADDQALVVATGPVSGQSMFLISFDPRARASTFGFTNRDPWDDDAWQEDGSQLLRDVNDDTAIAMTFALGDLAPGESVTFTYYTSLNGDLEEGLEEILHNLRLNTVGVFEGSPNGSIVGNLELASNCGVGTHSFVLTDNAGGRFDLVDNQVVVANGGLLDTSVATSHNITIAINCGEITINKTFTINVLPAPRPKLPLRPVFEGWTMNPDESFTAHWGWKNDNPYEVTVPVGDENKFTGEPSGGTTEPVTEFVYGRVYNAFETTFDGSNLVWSLKGPDGNTRTATASASGPVFDVARYQPLQPMIEGVTRNVYTSTYTAWWGWQNECAFPLTVPYEHSKFSGQTTPEGANPPNQFTAGRVYAAFSTEFDGSDLVWSLRGPDGQTRTATASMDSKLLEELVADSSSYSLNVGATHQTRITGKFTTKGVGSEEDLTQWVNYQSLNPEIVTVDSNGLVTARANGQATIKVSYWGMEKLIVVNVTSSGGGGGGGSSTDSGPAVTDLSAGKLIDRMPGYISLGSAVKFDTAKAEIVMTYNQDKLATNPNHTPRIYYWHVKSGKWVALATYPASSGKVKAINDGQHMGWFAVFGVKQPQFADVQNHWAEPDINRMNGLGMIEGYGSNDSQIRQFAPEGQITRTELAMYIYRLLNIDVKNPQLPVVPEQEVAGILQAKFSDAVEIPVWAQKEIAALVKAGIIDGRDNRFDGNAPITRIEAAVMITNALKVVIPCRTADLSVYADAATIPSWVNGLVGENILEGYNDNTLRANEQLTRAEAVTMLQRLFVTGLGW